MGYGDTVIMNFPDKYQTFLQPNIMVIESYCAAYIAHDI